MTTTRISDSDAFELAHGRVPARPDLNELADLLTDYRSAILGNAPRPSAALAERLDLSAPPITMQVDDATSSPAVGTGRTVKGLFGLGVTVTIILGAASGAAAVAGAGSAGLLPQGAQDAFDQIVSVIAPPGVVGQETTGQVEEPGDPAPTDPTVEEDAAEVVTPAVEPVEPVAVVPPAAPVAETPATTTNSNGNGTPNNNGNGNSENSNGNAGSGSSSNSGNGNSGNGNSGNGNGNSGHGNSDKDKDKSKDDKGKDK